MSAQAHSSSAGSHSNKSEQKRMEWREKNKGWVLETTSADLGKLQGFSVGWSTEIKLGKQQTWVKFCFCVLGQVVSPFRASALLRAKLGFVEPGALTSWEPFVSRRITKLITKLQEFERAQASELKLC